MKMEKAAENDARPTVKIGDQAAELDDKGLLSRFRVVDGDARSLGTYPSGEIAAAVKDLNGCRVYYFGVPLKAPLALFQALLARQSHPHLRREHGGKGLRRRRRGDDLPLYRERWRKGHPATEWRENHGPDAAVFCPVFRSAHGNGAQCVARAGSQLARFAGRAPISTKLVCPHLAA